MYWNILTYETRRGEEPVNEFIKKQRPQARSKITHNVRLLRQYGNLLGMPHAKMLSNNLYELRIRGKEEIRIFIVFKFAIFIYFIFSKNKHKRLPRKKLILR